MAFEKFFLFWVPMNFQKDWKSKLESAYSFMLKYSKITVCHVYQEFKEQARHSLSRDTNFRPIFISSPYHVICKDHCNLLKKGSQIAVSFQNVYNFHPEIWANQGTNVYNFLTQVVRSLYGQQLHHTHTYICEQISIRAYN